MRVGSGVVGVLPSSIPVEVPGGDGGGFHVAKGKQGASWKPATSRPG
jgi:hypothetical protein